MSNIIVITVNGNGLIDRVECDQETVPQGLPLFKATPDAIYIRPDWPPIGSPDFAVRLRAWHAQHNAPCSISVEVEQEHV